MDKSFTVAVAGLGRWGPNYVRIFDAMKDVRVAAAADPDPARREKIESSYDGIRCFSDVGEALECPGVEAVVVATPSETHYPVVKAALAAGKHVLCEKPLTTSSRQAWELVALAEERRRQLMVGHVFLFNPGIEYLAQAVASRSLGAPYYVRSVRTNLGPFRSDVNAAWDLASHDVYILGYLLRQRPLSVSALGAAYLRRGIEDVMFLTLRYPGGIVGHIHVSWLDPKKVRHITLVGEKQMITWDENGAPGPVMVYDRSVVREGAYDSFGEFQLLMREGDVVVPRIPSREPLAVQAREFVERCLSGVTGADKGSARQGAEAVDVLEAAARSLRVNGQLVEITYGG